MISLVTFFSQMLNFSIYFFFILYMKLISLIICIISTSYALMTSATCRCTDLHTESDCSYSEECKWNTACYPKLC
jgi:hypothetical protein